MPYPAVRLSIRSLLIVIALIGLNLAAAVATRRLDPVDPSLVGASDYGSGAPWFLSDGSKHVERTDFSVSARQKRMVRILYRRLPLTTPQIWAPVLASIAITILAITVPIGSPARRGQRPSSSSGQETSARHHPFRSVVRWMAIGCALIALMIAGAAYRPPANPSDEEIRIKLIDLSDIAIVNEGDVYYVSEDGTMRSAALRRDNSRGEITEPDLYVPIPGKVIPGKVISRPIKTVVFKEDGSILGYDEFPSDPGSIPHGLRPPSRALWQLWFPALFEWTPRPLPSRPFVIRDRVRSPLEMRSPILASAAITMLTLVLLRRQARSQWTDSVSAATTSPCQSPL